MKTQLFILLLFFSVSALCQKAQLKVKVTDFQNNVLSGEQIMFLEQTTQASYSGISDLEGMFVVELPAGKYDIKVKSVGEAVDFSTIEIPKLQLGQSYQTAEMQVQIEEAQSFTLDNLHFETGKWTITSSSYAELDELVRYLSLKKNISIEIGGHTDSDGDEASNQQLSQKRADAVKAYLVKKGIAAGRISAVGYGELKPVASNATAEGKALNRRTEVKIIQ
ncbi:MAG: OmpA family protein [Crocinitomicaceae bacterium]|nr:OmpA family protein [Crocinitomicaceae bacterium]